jgi:hypothetical protein
MLLIYNVPGYLSGQVDGAQGRQILSQNLIYFMNFVDFYHWQGVA